MLKVEIVMDEEKILAEGKYSLEDIYFTIDKAYAQKNLKKTDKGIYVGSGKDFCSFWNIILGLKKQDWFMSNVKKWLWYNSDDSDDENDFAIDDLLMHYAKRISVGA
ncbi:MAG: hypothetical protein RSA79_05390 [Oscillospiraceae bacterium]